MTEISTASQARVPVTSMASAAQVDGTAIAILMSLSFCHLLNDMLQSLLPALYPVLKNSLSLDYGEIGLITLTYQLTASLLQPVVGLWADRRPRPYSLTLGMGFTLVGLLLLSRSGSFSSLLIAAAMIGISP
jgi:FSR family fosmidomycin resistance protein-like MFS transporter